MTALAVTPDAIAYPADLSIQDPDGASEMDLGRVYSQGDLDSALRQFDSFLAIQGWYLVGFDDSRARVRVRL